MNMPSVTQARGLLRIGEVCYEKNRNEPHSISSSWLIASVLQGSRDICYERRLLDMHRFPA